MTPHRHLTADGKCRQVNAGDGRRRSRWAVPKEEVRGNARGDNADSQGDVSDHELRLDRALFRGRAMGGAPARRQVFATLAQAADAEVRLACKSPHGDASEHPT